MKKIHKKYSIKEVDEYLFKNGVLLSQYEIESTSDAELICYIGVDGRRFDLLINDEDLVNAIRDRLFSLDVKIVKKL